MAIRSLIRDRLAQKLPGLFGWLQMLWAVRVLPVFHVLKPIRFGVLTTLVGFVFLVGSDQGRDTLRALVEDGEPGKPIWFGFAALLWATLTWYCARVMLYFHFPGTAEDIRIPPRKKSLTDSERRQRWVRQLRIWLPRLLGVACLATIAFACVVAAVPYPAGDDVAHELYALGGLYAVLALVFFAIVTKRRDLAIALDNQLPSANNADPVAASARKSGALRVKTTAKQGFAIYRELKRLPQTVRTMLKIWLVLSISLFILAVSWPVETGQAIGAAPLLLIAIASWIPFGSALVYFGNRYEIPVITVAVIAASLFSLWNDNHAIRLKPDAPQSSPVLREDYVTRFNQWFDAVEATAPGKAHPLILVAAEGGGIRAAYWTATVLTSIQEKHERFAQHVFAISGVSGGSLGGGVFAALMAEKPKDGKLECRIDGVKQTAPLRRCAQAVLSADFLGPVMGASLYPDLVQRFLFFKVPGFDRARALEKSWEAAWRETIGNDRFAERFNALWRDTDGIGVPNLILNSTWVESGKRVLISNLRTGSNVFNDAVDLYQVLPEATDLRLSTAIHASARFTYVSPAGAVMDRSGNVWGHLVDGGYFENSGATAISELLQALARDVDRKKWKRVVPILIVISNDPADSGSSPDPMAYKPDARQWANEILSPLLTLLNTRGARGTYAKAVLRQTGQDRYFAFGLCGSGKPLPLGWQLSKLARVAMAEQLEQPCRKKRDNPSTMKALDNRLQRYGL